MIIPENLQAFPHPALLIISDFSGAKIYLADQTEINEIANAEAPPPSKPDSEGAIVGSGSRVMNPSPDVDQGSERNRYSKNLAEKLSDLITEHNIAELQLIMPPEMLRRLQEDLPNKDRELVTKTIDKDLMKEEMINILERLHQIPKPIKQ